MAKPNEIIYKTATGHLQSLEKGEYTSTELVQAYLDQSTNKKDLGLFLRLDGEKALDQAAASDRRRKEKKLLGPLDGIPVAVKDNILEKGELATCGSKFLENFQAPYSATVIEKLQGAGAILMGRANMDEFAMGSSTENSALQLTKNPWDPERVPGGSSGGSAASVAASAVPLSLGSDTGGSIRQPAALCGVVGVKPTYGRVSRYGLVAFASSLDQIGPFSRSVEDSAILLSVINGRDRRDSTSHPKADEKPVSASVAPMKDKDWKDLRVGVLLPDGSEGVFDESVLKSLNDTTAWLEKKGAKVVPLKSQMWEYVIPIYYILATAEASSNLGRYDGVRYGRRAEDASGLMELYVRSRTEGFGPEVKRRILLGTYVLSSGYYDAYYNSAQKARRLIQKEYADFFSQVDVILQPTSTTTAFKIGEKAKNPVAMYQSDLMTISVNLGGVPAMNIPGGVDQNGLPIGLQLTAGYFQEDRLFQIGAGILGENPGYLPDFSSIKG